MGVIDRAESIDSQLQIRPARADEADVVLDVLAEAAAWLRGRGIEQWPARFDTRSVATQIDAAEALIVERPAGPVVATAVVSGSPDELWADHTEPALYISRLAVVRAAAGEAVGYRIIDWVEAKARDAGLRVVRLATSLDNPRLRAYYEAVGFEHVADPPGATWPTSLYQRAVGSHPRADPGRSTG